MTSLATAGRRAALQGTPTDLPSEALERLAEAPLECIDTEYPHYVGSVEGPDEVPEPSADHPIFYGCFDWHSAVHSHWCLVRQLRVVESHPLEETIRSRIADRLTPEAIAGECEYLENNETFERPYGWAWLVRLAADLHLWDDGPAEWRRTLAPLEELVCELADRHLLSQDRPLRVGTHGNSAFALSAFLDYARVVDAPDMESRIVQTARDWYADDRGAPVSYEPLGWDFLSPALVEANLMRRVYDDAAFVEWLEEFLSGMETPSGRQLLAPIEIPADPTDPLQWHFVGLNLSKAWSLAALAATLDGHRWQGTFAHSAMRHAEAGLDRAFTVEYAGAHWLLSFVVYLVSRNAGGIGLRPEP